MRLFASTRSAKSSTRLLYYKMSLLSEDGGRMFTGNNLAMEPSGRNSQISELIDKLQVEYARYIGHSSSTCRGARPCLTQVPRNRLRGSWISTDAASLKLGYQRSFNGQDDAVIFISVRDRVIEEHYISKLHFSWPQVACMSGFPARGSRTIILSYKDGIGQMQKFVLRFLTVHETEKFMSVVKDTLESGSPEPVQSLEYNSQWSSQAEVIPSAGPAYIPEDDWQSTTSAKPMTPLMLSSSKLHSAQDRVSYERTKTHEVGEAMPVFPPSFTQLLKNCQPEVSQEKPGICGEDLKTQFMRYLGGTSFKELLATVENVLGELGNDIVF